MKRSGYEVTIKAFWPCDVNKHRSVHGADNTIDMALEAMGKWGFIAVTETRKYRQRATVNDAPDGPALAAAAQPLVQPGTAEGFTRTTTPDAEAAALASVGAQVTAGVGKGRGAKVAAE